MHPCGNTTVDPSGLCYQHRNARNAPASASGASSIPHLGNKQTAERTSDAAAKPIGREGYKRVFTHWKNTEYSRGLIGILDDLGPRSYEILESRCAKLTAREARSVIMALSQVNTDFEIHFQNPLKRPIEQAIARRQLAFEINKLSMIAPVCCAVVHPDRDLALDMSTVSSLSEKKSESAWQTLKETVFGLSDSRKNQLRGDAIYLTSGCRTEAEESEWFGENWDRIQPIWEKLVVEKTVYRSRTEVLLDKGFEDVPDVLMDGAL